MDEPGAIPEKGNAGLRGFSDVSEPRAGTALLQGPQARRDRVASPGQRRRPVAA